MACLAVTCVTVFCSKYIVCTFAIEMGVEAKDLTLGASDAKCTLYNVQLRFSFIELISKVPRVRHISA